MPFKRGGPLRLIQSLRDEGTLLWDRRGERPVVYAIDLYNQGEMQSGDGDVRGDLTSLVGRAPPNVRLRLADGGVVAVALTDIEPDGANIVSWAHPASRGLAESAWFGRTVQRRADARASVLA